MHVAPYTNRETLYATHTAYLRVLCGSENKQLLFPYTALTGWFYSRDGVCLNTVYNKVS